jgi:predicted regulator of Ras-like GTPase activity (Roadblock/LC7/MglB family)
MTTVNVSQTQSQTSILSSQDAILSSILGVAIFDLNGLPREYFVTQENKSTQWVQLVFQALGLKSLLMSSLKVEGFSHISIHYGNRTAVVVRAKNDYIALLLQEPLEFASTKQADQFSQWVRHFEADILRKHKRFMTA